MHDRKIFHDLFALKIEIDRRRKITKMIEKDFFVENLDGRESI